MKRLVRPLPVVREILGLACLVDGTGPKTSLDGEGERNSKAPMSGLLRTDLEAIGALRKGAASAGSVWCDGPATGSDPDKRRRFWGGRSESSQSFGFPYALLR